MTGMGSSAGYRPVAAPERAAAQLTAAGGIMYMNEQGQTVSPLTGETVMPSDPFAHISLLP
jgi:hypothetical protein